jgi:hypothetical protein
MIKEIEQTPQEKQQTYLKRILKYFLPHNPYEYLDNPNPQKFLNIQTKLLLSEIRTIAIIIMIMSYKYQSYEHDILL